MSRAEAAACALIRTQPKKHSEATIWPPLLLVTWLPWRSLAASALHDPATIYICAILHFAPPLALVSAAASQAWPPLIFSDLAPQKILWAGSLLPCRQVSPEDPGFATSTGFFVFISFFIPCTRSGISPYVDPAGFYCSSSAI
ncbi:hypothetical protein GOP47_0016593 [Adiantum capillus-veneris]|uniref:Uncharacterized protein n=1 Tax=Adiantum capillus-veneris TaxID=13818 RepID=A0A9D4UHY5_ADICA|nr:hypothetical protein GOP47_0016593 [Adiantum capillus-veneris]